MSSTLNDVKTWGPAWWQRRETLDDKQRNTLKVGGKVDEIEWVEHSELAIHTMEQNSDHKQFDALHTHRYIYRAISLLHLHDQTR